MTPEQVKRNLELATILGGFSINLAKTAGLIAAETRAGEIFPATIGQAKAAATAARKTVEALEVFAAENATGPSPLYHGQGN
jgi:hypothetical protein